MVMRWLKDWLFGDSPEQRREKERKAEWEAHVAENRIKAIHAARSFIAQSPVIFDTETTGLDKTDEVVEIACVDIDGNVLMNALVKPTCSVSDGARAVHGIGDDQLAASRSMGDLAHISKGCSPTAWSWPMGSTSISDSCANRCGRWVAPGPKTGAPLEERQPWRSTASCSGTRASASVRLAGG